MVLMLDVHCCQSFVLLGTEEKIPLLLVITSGLLFMKSISSDLCGIV